MINKIIVIINFILVTTSIGAQSKIWERTKIGISSSFFTTIAGTLLYEFDSEFHVYASFGHRFPGGYFNNDDRTRTGGILMGMKSVEIYQQKETVIHLFSGFGGYAAFNDLIQSRYPLSLDLGYTLGIGMFIQTNDVQFSIFLMPGQELTGIPDERNRFDPRRCSGISITIPLVKRQ
jgi:hypothetical protein